jgi:hypothetical protein
MSRARISFLGRTRNEFVLEPVFNLVFKIPGTVATNDCLHQHAGWSKAISKKHTLRKHRLVAQRVERMTIEAIFGKGDLSQTAVSFFK